MNKAIVSNLKTVEEIEVDSDGGYMRKVTYGNVLYTCCNKSKVENVGYISKGDGDPCPFCRQEIEYTYTTAAQQKVFFESPYNYSHIDLLRLREEINKACANGTRMTLIDLQDMRHILESLIFCELAEVEKEDGAITYSVKHPSPLAR